MSYSNESGVYERSSLYANYDLEANDVHDDDEVLSLQPHESICTPGPGPSPTAAATRQAQTVQASQDPNAILNECRDVDEAISRIDRYIDHISFLRQQFLAEIESLRERELRAQANAASEDLRFLYRSVLERIRFIKQTPGAGAQPNRRAVEKVQRRIEGVIRKYQEADLELWHSTKEQMMRQYRIVKPEASEEEVQSEIDRASYQDMQNMFSEALLQSDRRGEVFRVNALVQRRHDDVRQIERELKVLAQTFEDLNVLVIQQDFAADDIEQKTEVVKEDVKKANRDIKRATSSARSRNRKKWWIALTVVAIICVIVAVVLAATLTQK